MAVLHCLRSRRAHCAATTTTTLPQGIPDLTGDWTLTLTGSGDSCPPGVDAFLAPSVASRPNLGVLQAGVGVHTCAAGEVTAGIDPISRGTVSADGLTLESGGTVTPPPFAVNGAYDFSRHVSGQIAGDHVDIVDEWDLTPTGLPSGRAACTDTLQGVLVRVAPRACRSQADCIATDACLRCVNGACTHIPACW